ncbi:MAG: hypothetical protein PW735_02320 [Acidobacteriaceae bacterium]|nr:hypothetical protein [Acidobacteriaceae bacterium]
MKWTLGILLLASLVFVWVEREQLYVRDPLASVTENGVERTGVQVYLNYNNEVLLEQDHPSFQLRLMQRGNHVGVPARIKCIHWVACLLDAPLATLVEREPLTVDAMDARHIAFHDANGMQGLVTLR